ncbi:MAG: proline dehydrogenase family protein [bacterium]|nr:proline dehydrogenase family protein [bacterium]
MLPIVPRPIVERVAARYVAGKSLEDALTAARRLNAEGARATIDILGESVKLPELAEAAVAQYLELIDAVNASGVDSSVSVKPTMLGLNIDTSLFRRHMHTLAQQAAAHGVVLTIDMEDRTTTDATLKTFHALHESFGSVGCVLQAYMRRTLHDIDALPANSNVRLCKGIYVEPEEVAFKGYQEVRNNYMRALDRLVAGGHFVGIATHDEWLIAQSENLVSRLALTRDQYEFQMLLGVKPPLRKRLITAGHPLRVYVPFGADWHAYSLRRLRENPQVAVHVLRAMLAGK